MKIGSPLLATALACSACLGSSVAAAAADATRQTASAVFTERHGGASTGIDLAIDYVNPADPAAKPPAVRTVVLKLARGSVIDTGAVPQCEASDAQLMLLGPSACAQSVVGDGALSLDTGLAEPLRFLQNELTLLNDAGELIFLFRQQQLGARLATRSPITDGRVITSQAPFLPGTPPDGAAVDVVSESIAATAGAAYITTPRRCPRRRRWINRWAFTYADGVTQTVRSRSRCRRG